MDELNALMKLNEAMMMQGYEADFEIHLADKDFEKFVYRFETERPSAVHYPEARVNLKDVNWVKIAGPGCYWHVKRKRT